MKKIIASIITVSVCTFACQSNSKSEDSKTNLDTLATADSAQYPKNLEADSFPNGELVHESGLLKHLEDGGYPFATLTIEFPERKFEETFSLNFEEVKNINQALMTNSVGKYLDFSYSSTVQNALMDIQSNGKTIFGSDAIPITNTMKKATGILSGAKEITAGDLPGKIIVSNSNHETLEFEYFITQEIVKLNGKPVTVFYEERTNNQVIELKVLK